MFPLAERTRRPRRLNILKVAAATAKQQNTAHSLEEWEVHKAVLHKHFILGHRTLDEVRNYMREEHNFEASKQQYERKFRKWGFTKNLKKQDWITRFELEKRGVPTLGNSEPSYPLKTSKRFKQALSRYKHAPPRLASAYLSETTKAALLCLELLLKDIIVKFLTLQSENCCGLAHVGCSRHNVAKTYLRKFLPSQIDEVCQIHEIRSIRSNLPTWKLRLFADHPPDQEQTVFANKLRELYVSSQKNTRESRTSALDSHMAGRSVPPFSLYDPFVNESLPAQCSVATPTTARGLDTSVSSFLFCLLCILMLETCNSQTCTESLFQYLTMEGVLDLRTRITSVGLATDSSKNNLECIFREAQRRDLFYQCILLVGLGIDIHLSPRSQCLARFRSSTILESTIYSYCTPLIDVLLKCGSNPSRCGEHVDTESEPCCYQAPIHFVLGRFNTGVSLDARNFCRETLKKFLQHGAKIPAAFDLTRAIESWWMPSNTIDCELLSLLIAGGASPEGAKALDVGNKYFSPLQAVLGRKQSDAARCLLNHLEKMPLGCSLQHIETLINHREVVFDGSDMTKKYEYRSPLALALTFDLEVANQLIEVAIDNSYENMLHSNMPHWRLKPVPIRVGNFIAQDGPESWHPPPLAVAIKSGNTNAVRVALAARAHTSLFHFTWPPLVYATLYSHHEIVQFLSGHHLALDDTSPEVFRLDRTTSHNMRSIFSESGWKMSPLAIASAQGDLKKMYSLLEAGADISQDRYSWVLTPLSAAILSRQQSAIDLLLSDPNVDTIKSIGSLWLGNGGWDGIRPLYLALFTNQVEVARRLTLDQPEGNWATKQELDLLETALTQALKVGDFAWVQSLLDTHHRLDKTWAMTEQHYIPYGFTPPYLHMKRLRDLAHEATILLGQSNHT